MRIRTGQASAFSIGPDLLFFAVAAIALLPLVSAAQGLTGSLTGRVRDEQGARQRPASKRYEEGGALRERCRGAETLRNESGADVNVTYVGSWFDHPSFIAAHAAHVREAQARLPAPPQRPRGQANLRQDGGQTEVASYWRMRRSGSRPARSWPPELMVPIVRMPTADPPETAGRRRPHPSAPHRADRP